MRDWNTGKIPYFTIPPAVHSSSMPDRPNPAAPAAASILGEDDVDMTNEVGDAKILNTLSEAFSIDGLFDTLGDEAAWEGEEDIQEDGPAWEAEEAAQATGQDVE